MDCASASSSVRGLDFPFVRCLSNLSDFSLLVFIKSLIFGALLTASTVYSNFSMLGIPSFFEEISSSDRLACASRELLRVDNCSSTSVFPQPAQNFACLMV